MICATAHVHARTHAHTHARTHTHTYTHTISSETWRQLPAAKRRELLEGGEKGREDGEFWMSFGDFKKHFTDFEVCNVSIDQLYEDEASKHKLKCPVYLTEVQNPSP